MNIQQFMEGQLQEQDHISDFDHRIVPSPLDDGKQHGQIQFVAVCDYTDKPGPRKRMNRLVLVAAILLKSRKVVVVRKMVMASDLNGTCSYHAAHLARKLEAVQRRASNNASANSGRQTLFTGGSNSSVLRGVTKTVLSHPLLPVGLVHNDPAV